MFVFTKGGTVQIGSGARPAQFFCVLAEQKLLLLLLGANPWLCLAGEPSEEDEKHQGILRSAVILPFP